MFHDTLQQGLDGGRERYHGKYPATVTNNAPEAAQVPGCLVVQVARFPVLDPADPATLKPMECVARPCLPPGAFIVPDVGAAVWVEFVDGDLAYPVWTGVWYPAEAAPANPEGEQPTADQRLLRSVAGHLLCLDDSAGAERVVLQDVSDNVLTMNKDGIEIKCGTSVSLALKTDAIVLTCGTNTITLGNDGIKLEGAGHKLNLEAGGTTLNGKLVVLETLLSWLSGHTHMSAPADVPITPPMQITFVSQMPG